ncbi:MAG: DUF111 family protein [Candidatus Thermoplasmatota archaeon]|nr:DUF111 family protein [Candidatus Thermoplasmatota archaeon]
MIFIDAREGLAGDMLLSAMAGLLEPEDRGEFLDLLAKAARLEGVSLTPLEVEDAGDKGILMAHSMAEMQLPETHYHECLARLKRVDAALGSGGATSLEILEHIFQAESEAHALPKEEVHLHEIGRPQALLNICGIGKLAEILAEKGAGDFVCSTISTGGGVVVIDHGAVRVPPPATQILLRGLRHITGDSPGERATPTGIAAVKTLMSSQSDVSPGTFIRRSVGFGTKRFAGRLGRTVLTWS